MSGSREHFDKLIRMFGSAPINRTSNAVLTIETGRATLKMPVVERHLHAAAGVHGSIYFKLLDDAAFFAANSIVEDACLLTASFSTEFFRPSGEGTLEATGRLTKPGKNLLFASSILRDAAGRELARGSGVFARSAFPLDASIGYV